MRILPGILAAVFVAGPACAESAPGAAFLNRPQSVRQMGMGNVGLGENDLLRAWANPAVLAGQETAWEFALNGVSRPETGQSSWGVGAGWRPANQWGLGLFLASSGISLGEVDEFGVETGQALAQDSIVLGMAASRVIGPVRAGLTAKYVSENLAGESAGTVGFDAGVLGTWAGISAGASIRNLGGTLRAGEAGIPGESLPVEIRLGAAYRLEKLKASVGGEYIVAAGRQGVAGLGVCWSPVEMFTARGGYSGLAAEMDPMLTVGFTGRYAGIGLDYAAGLHDLGLAHRVALTYSFGTVPEASAAESEPEPDPVREAVAAAKGSTVVLEEPPDTKPNVAVMDFTAQNVSAGDAAVMADLLRGELIRTGSFNIIEKQNMEKILAEQAFQNSGCTTSECAVKLGKLLNVHKIMVGSFGKVMNIHVITIRVVDVETGKVVYGDKVTGSSLGELDKGITALAKRIAKQLK